MSLERLAHGRSGDKGDASNVGLVARSAAAYAWMVEQVTAAWVKGALSGFVRGPVERHEVPNLRALNFIRHDSLGGGGSESLLSDAQGKTHAQALLRSAVEVPALVLASVEAAGDATAG